MKRKHEFHWMALNPLPAVPPYLLSLLVLLVVGFSIVLIQWSVLIGHQYSFAVGEPAPQTYRVVAPMTYEDRAAAAALKEMANESIVGVTVRDLSAKPRLQRRLDSLNSAGKDTQGLLSYVPEPLLKAVAQLSDGERTRLLALASEVGNACLERLGAGNVLTDGTTEITLLWEEINKRVTSVKDANLIYQILAKLGDLNLRIDKDLTENVKRDVMKGIHSIERRFEMGDIIIARGETVTAQHASLLRLQGYTEDVFPLTQLCVVLIIVLLLPLWFGILSRDDGSTPPPWKCVVFVIAVAWVGELLAAYLHIRGAGLMSAVIISCLCVPGVLAFGAALVGTVSGAFLMTGFAISDILLLMGMAVFVSTLGFYRLCRLDSRRQATHRAFWLTVHLALIRVVLQWLQGWPLAVDACEFWLDCGKYVLFELLGTHIVLILLPSVEEYLGVLSVLRLREISHPSNHLLRTLQREAPGTYQHCLTIATLVESVAMELGLDVNLMKAGAYYHDIGKLRRPQFFVENQGGGLNTHDEMSPELSAITIISHVNEGLQLAWEAKLPRRIRDFIAEHHGTTCVRYFYNKARAMGENAEWSDFCYPGPKPRSRETALLMIADSMEAAVRSLNLGRELVEADNEPDNEPDEPVNVSQPHPNRGRSQYIQALQQVIDQVVDSKAGEGQFSEVDFTQKDFTTIKAALLSALLSMYHTRRVKKIEKK
ncbi:MAG: HDIG domain-containing protein [Fretibacterium sp.]|nr:HDIG domain-containing protein [Fretibacterium sp.]